VTLRIFIADDHEVVRHGLRSLLENGTGWTVCGEAVDGRQAVERVLELVPDMVVMDVSMPQLNGLEATRQIVSQAPRIPVLMLSVNDSEDMVRQVVAAGARGFVLKSDTGRDLLVAIDEVRQGRPFFSARLAGFILEGYLKGGAPEPPPAPTAALTAREREVLQLLAEGQSNKQVAASLSIGVKTAEAHRANLMRKLGMHSLSTLVRYAIRNRLVEP
jgi:DNA-binding NarL/FixJ family response regulator